MPDWFTLPGSEEGEPQEMMWYRVDESPHHQFYLVNPETGERRPAFNHRRVSKALAEVSETSFTPGSLPFRHFNFVGGLDRIRFRFQSRYWECDLEAYRCEQEGTLPVSIPSSIDSPDGRYAAFTREGNLWVFDREEQREIQVTEDGEEGYAYAINSQGWTRSDLPVLKWSPDSRRIATFRQDDRGVKQMSLVRTLPGRPELERWPYALPGDTVVPMLERVVVDVEAREVVHLDIEPSHQRASNCCGLLRGVDWVDVEWSRDGEKLAFVTTSRDYSTVKLYLADPQSGEVRKVFSETLAPFFESNLTSRGTPNWTVLHESGEFIWFTRADNWGHLYLHDLSSGERKRQITRGSWNVIDLIRVDEEKRTLLLTGVGREEGRDPYFTHLYRVNLDDGGVDLLTPEAASHDISISPSGNHFVTRMSTPETPPVSWLRSVEGDRNLELDRMDAEGLREVGFRPPEPFTVKARDGETDLYGLLIKPSDFDPEKSYPVVNSIYPGPQVGSVGPRSFTTMRRGQAHALAELGVVVVLLDALGTPWRSADFHTWWYGDMSDNGLEDQVSAMEQLADRHDWIDLERVGIYGHSGGGYATATAMFRYPDFFRVGVASAGNHDNRGYTYYWGEKYQGVMEEPGGESYMNQANPLMVENLKGRLLITYGTMDSNVHPNMTLQVVDRLISHNKDFDLMVFPNRDHGYVNEPYNLRITWNYFIRHLLGQEPPSGSDVSFP